MGKVNRKYLVGGAVLIIIAFILWGIVYYIDYSVTDNYHNAVDEYLTDWESSEKKEVYNEASKQYDDAKSYIANVAVLIVIIGLIGFILIAISILKGEKKSKYDASNESIDERYAKGEITKKQYEKMKKENK
ncbi:MAG: hypothetical protein BV456_11005 [Thermoplasmata archaeon M8B2D]|nr:MAG: hypothetical protein BV456_11005 [Thermoplasmata archaeon M8B2D]